MSSDSCDETSLPREGQGLAAEEAKVATVTKKPANSYYYWHGHEKERAKVGDVAPMPQPVLVRRDEVPATLQLTSTPVTRYSWADDTANVTLYVDVLENAEEQLVRESVKVDFTRATCRVSFAVAEEGKAERRRHLILHLAKKVDPAASSYKVRPSNKVLVITLVKATQSPWYDLTGQATSDAESSQEDATLDDAAVSDTE